MCTLECWKPVQGYEHLYEVSNMGQVRSLPREVPFINGSIRKLKGKLLKPLIDNNGYLYVCLAFNGVQKSKFVHRLVAESFISSTDDTLEVNHIDGNKHNNCVDNLEWVTHKYNIQHSFVTGLHQKPLVQHMREIGRLGNRISCERSSQPVLCIDDNLAFVSKNAADRYYGNHLGTISEAITKRSGKYKGKTFRDLSNDELDNYTLLS